MKTLTLLLALALVPATLALLPGAEATNRCTFLDSWCPGVVCYHNGVSWLCVLGHCDPHACPDPRDLLPDRVPPLLP